MTLGVEQAGFNVAAAVEIDPIHCAAHHYNFPDCAVICRSVVDLTGEEIRQIGNIGQQDLDLVVGGPPCQGVSLMGYRALDDPRNELMLHYMRLVLELNPKYFIMENVKGLTLGPHAKILDEVIEGFESGGYKVERDYRVLNAANYGVPQDRQRVFLMGWRNGLAKPSYPIPTTISSGAQNSKNLGFLTTTLSPTVMDAIADIPNADLFPELIDSDTVRTELGAPSAYASRLRGATDPDDYSHPRMFAEDLLTSSMRTVHTKESIERFAATPTGSIEPISRFPRLRPDGVCNTLRAGTGSERGAHTSPRPIHPLYPRCITVREAARLHSYPDWFRFHVTKWHGFRQIGNSVPPLLGRAVASEIMKALGRLPDRPRKHALTGPIALLSFTMTTAATYFSVDRGVVGTRTRKNGPDLQNTTVKYQPDLSSSQLRLFERKRRLAEAAVIE